MKTTQNPNALNRLCGIDKLILFLYASYFILSPFYLWSSGLPQLADIILTVTMVIYLLDNRFKIPINIDFNKFVGIALFFLIWVIVTNFSWAFLLQTTEIFFRTTLFYFYNFLVLVLTVSLATKYKKVFIETVFTAIIISVSVQFILFIAGGGFVGARITGTFNNPNQLGYYAILVSGFIMFFNNELKIKGKTLIMSLFFSSILVLASLSNGAIISWFILYFFFLLTKSKNKKTKNQILLFTLILMILASFLYNTATIIQENDFFQSVESRLSQTQDKVGVSSTVRGYNRLTEYPEYWILGAGEGSYYRFYGHGGEFHSTLGTIQVSYGIVGTILFLYLIWYALKKDNFIYTYIIFAILLYGLSHNGLRNSMLWILLSIMLAHYNFKKKGSAVI